MKTLTILLTALVLSVLCHEGGDLYAQESGEVTTLRSFGGHLRSGNIRVILNMLTEPLLSEQKRLLETNPEYPQWLSNFYKNASLQIVGVKRVDAQQAIIDIAIDRKNNEPLSKTRLILKLEGGKWKISEEVSDF